MTETFDTLPLAADFPPATQAQWRKLVDDLLKGAPFERILVAQTYDGLSIQPLYARDRTAQPIVGRAGGRAWQILQRVDHPDAASANLEARHDCENGATGLSLVFAGSLGGYGYGLKASKEAVAQALEGTDLASGRVAVELDLGLEAEAAVRAVSAIAPGANVRFGLDPLGAMASQGGAARDAAETATQLGRLIADLAGVGFKGPFAVADGRVIHNAGGTEAQELAYVLGAAAFYLRTLDGAGLGLDAARHMIFFRLSADADQFLTIAKFRALRLLWARVEEACGLAPAPVFVSAETAWRTMTQRDPYVNMLRATIAVFAAGLGGADAITVLPFTLARGLPDRFARRMARNTQLILLQESNLARVADPAAGAGSIETLTADLCHAAWALFQHIERAGGAMAAFRQGLIQAQVADARQRRQAALARRFELLTGTSDFADLAEPSVPVLDVAPAAVSPEPAAFRFEALPRIRLAAPFERLREASDRVATQTGSRPRIFLASLGPAADFTARATFAKNFFEAGGIEAPGNDGFADVRDMISAFKTSDAQLACLCSSDEVYGREAVPAARALVQAGCGYLYHAGRPGPREAELVAAGVGTFIYAGCDGLAILQDAQAKIASHAAPAKPI